MKRIFTPVLLVICAVMLFIPAAEAVKQPPKVKPTPAPPVAPAPPVLQWQEGYTLLTEGRLKDAVRFYRVFLAHNPRSVEGWYWLGITLSAMGRYDQARPALDMAASIDPKYPALQPERTEPIFRNTNSVRIAGKGLPGPVSADKPLFTTISPRRPAPTAVSSADLKPYNPWAAGRDGYRGSSGPGWMTDKKFEEIKNSPIQVDTVGLLNYPHIPVAWHSAHPNTMLAWTGSRWYAMYRRDVRTPLQVPNLYELLWLSGYRQARDASWRAVPQKSYTWNDAHTPLLIDKITEWKYKWGGYVSLEDM